MMFLRHGTFARKSKVERRRKLVVSGFAGLLLAAAVIVCTTAQASGNLNLAYSDATDTGLTGGNITGTLSKVDDSAATNIDRDGQIKLNLEFNLDDNEIENAKNADAWTYDLSSAVGSGSVNPFVASVENITSPASIVKDSVTIAEYTVQSNVITVVPQSTSDATTWWTTHSTNVSIDLSVILNLDKVGVGLHIVDAFELPGTVGTVTTNDIDYSSREATVFAMVYDEPVGTFGTNSFNMTAVQEDDGSYFVTYNTEFFVNFYAPDLKVNLTLSGDQVFNTNKGFIMRTCVTDFCIFDSGVTTISIPADYITYSGDNKSAEIRMEDFLYDYCEVGSHDCSGADIFGYTLNNSMSINNANGSDYYIQFEADLGSTNPVGAGKTYGMGSTVTSDVASREVYSAVNFSVNEDDPGFINIGDDIDDPINSSNGIIEKNDLTVQNLDSTNKITYAIKVNESGYAYLNNGDPYEPGETRPMLTVTDQIPANVNLLTTAFSATNLDPDNPANYALSSSDAIVCADDYDIIVYDCSFRYNSETYTLIVNIPDGLTRKIWYSVVVAHPIPGDTTTYSNTAELHINDDIYYGVASRSHTVDDSVSGGSNGTMSIKKVNADDLTEAIEGVEFKLVQVAYDATTGVLGTETEIDLNGAEDGIYGTTDSNGLLRISSLCGYAAGANQSCLDGGQLYYWQEVSAPNPYILTNGTVKHYFILYDDGVTASDTWDNYTVAWDVADLITGNNNNDFAIEVLGTGYEWLVTNLRQIETSIAIGNQVTGNTASVDKNFTITIHATNQVGEPLVGSFDYDTYLVDSLSNSLSYEGVVNFVNGDATVTLNHGSGIVIYGVYVGGSYTITESNNNGYTVSYVCSDLAGTGCSSATSNSGVFVADNGAAADASSSGNVTFSDVGQAITLINDSSTEITGVFNKKPSLVIAIAFGGAFMGLGIFVVRKIRG